MVTLQKNHFAPLMVVLQTYGGVVCLGPNIQSWMLLGAGDGGKLNDDDESRSPQEIVKKSSLDVDFKRNIIKLLHMWPGTFLLLFCFE